MTSWAKFIMDWILTKEIRGFIFSVYSYLANTHFISKIAERKH